MTQIDPQHLCMTLMHAESEAEVLRILENAGLWLNPSVWRNYGDDDGNYSTIGNQMSRPDAALVEKLVNSIDARLILECRLAGTDPTAADAPRSIRAAVARFFDDADPAINPVAGLVGEWSSQKRTAIARDITLAATGPKAASGYPNFTISDAGEGQTPDAVPETFMSLRRTNKINIPFVQGKFNMGGTGVLQFCGKNNLQLVVTRRCPELLRDAENDDHMWSFTVVRRELPSAPRRSSVFTYLAPMGAAGNPHKGGVLRFAADSLPLFPDEQTPYARSVAWGSLVKLYEYHVAERGHMFLKGGLLERLDILLPGAALPVRLHECRPYRGKRGSFETTMSGLRVRLDDNRGSNLEPHFPTSAPLRAAGMPMVANIYAFLPNAADSYRKSEGIIFTVNGQTHGHFTLDFFRRKRAGKQDYLARSLLVIVNCDRIEGGAREDLFMNSRDRLRGGELRAEIETELEQLLAEHNGLRELRERRRREEIESKLEDEQPLQDVLESILKRSPTLSALFKVGKRLSSPFKTKLVAESDKSFQGRSYPTFFKFAGLEYGALLRRDANLGRRVRIRFETDARNDYFTRAIDPGRVELWLDSNGHKGVLDSFVLNLYNGVATLNLPLPEGAAVGADLRYEAVVSDSSRVEDFVNSFLLHVQPPVRTAVGNGNRRRNPGQIEGRDREAPSALSLPNVVLVGEHQWQDREPAFDQYTALRVKGTVEAGDNGHSSEVYDFFINMDNAYFKHELKYVKGNDGLRKAQWKYGLVLIGLGLLQDVREVMVDGERSSLSTQGDQADGIADLVDRATRAIAPILLPMIDYLGDLDADITSTDPRLGEAT